MSDPIEITCIVKDDRYNPYERITHVGGYGWLRTQEQVIGYIESGSRFFVRKNGRDVKVIVSRSRFGNKYLKTEADGDEPNNLLSLGACPVGRAA